MTNAQAKKLVLIPIKIVHIDICRKLKFDTTHDFSVPRTGSNPANSNRFGSHTVNLELSCFIPSESFVNFIFNFWGEREV